MSYGLNIDKLASTIEGEGIHTQSSMFGVASAMQNRLQQGIDTPKSIFSVGSFQANNHYTPPSAFAYKMAQAVDSGTVGQYGNPGNATYYNGPGGKDFNAYNSVPGAQLGPRDNAYSDTYGQPGSSSFQPPQYGADASASNAAPNNTVPFADVSGGQAKPNAFDNSPTPDTSTPAPSSTTTPDATPDSSGSLGGSDVTDLGPYGGTLYISPGSHPDAAINPQGGTGANPNTIPGSGNDAPLPSSAPGATTGTYQVQDGTGLGGSGLPGTDGSTQGPFSLTGPSVGPSGLVNGMPATNVAPGSQSQAPSMGDASAFNSASGMPVTITDVSSAGSTGLNSLSQSVTSGASAVSSGAQSAANTLGTAVNQLQAAGTNWTGSLLSGGTDISIRLIIGLFAIALLIGAFLFFVGEKSDGEKLIPIPV